MDFKNLSLTLDDGLLTIVINRESKMNALNAETIKEISKAFEQVYDDNEIKAVILTGAGEKSFVAGADIGELSALSSLNGRKFSERGQSVFSSIENCPKPVVAAVNGYALGGGCELAMACHIRIGSENAKFGQPEVNLGIIPGYGGTQRLTQLVGKGRAFELILTGEIISAEDAYRIGLINHLTSPEALMPKAKKIAQKIMEKAAVAVAQSIDSINAVFSADDGYQKEANAFGSCLNTEDFKEGTTAFLQKRKPVFIGK